MPPPYEPTIPRGTTCPRCDATRFWYRPGNPWNLRCAACLPPPKGEPVVLFDIFRLRAAVE